MKEGADCKQLTKTEDDFALLFNLNKWSFMFVFCLATVYQSGNWPTIYSCSFSIAHFLNTFAAQMAIAIAGAHSWCPVQFILS